MVSQYVPGERKTMETKQGGRKAEGTREKLKKKKQMAEEDIREHTNYSIRRVVWINMILIQLSSINTC